MAKRVSLWTLKIGADGVSYKTHNNLPESFKETPHMGRQVKRMMQVQNNEFYVKANPDRMPEVNKCKSALLSMKG